MIRRYWRFQFDNYYPLGGMRDFNGDSDDPESLIPATDADGEYFQIMDSHTRELIPDSRGDTIRTVGRP